MRTNIFKIFRIIIATMIGSMSTMIGAMPAQAASTDVNQCEIVDYNIAYYDSLTTICPESGFKHFEMPRRQKTLENQRFLPPYLSFKMLYVEGF